MFNLLLFVLVSEISVYFKLGDEKIRRKYLHFMGNLMHTLLKHPGEIQTLFT